MEPHRALRRRGEIQGRLFADDHHGDPVTCPHCGASALDVDRGATGLDLCLRCGGLSRKGEKLDREPFQNFDQPVMVDLAYLHARGVVVHAWRTAAPASPTPWTTATRLPPIVVSGDQATSLGRLVTDALASIERTAN